MTGRLLSAAACAALLVVSLLVAPAPAAAQSFTFATVTTQGVGLWGAIEQFIRPLNRPVPFVTLFNTTGDGTNTWAVAPAGSFLLWGTQPDISISPDQGTTWWYVAGTSAANGNIDKRTINPNFPGVAGSASGNTGCSHRGAFNRFYLIGNHNGGTLPTTVGVDGTQVRVWFSWASNDGQVWNQVMSNGSSYAMAQQRYANGGSNTQDHVCVVDSNEYVYDVGAADTWRSVNLGVGWAAVSSSSYFPVRWGLSAAIYSPTATTDTIVVLGGTNNATYALMNDVWSSTNGGQSWAMVGTAQWSPRQEPNFAIHSNGVMVVYGGDCGGGWCGVAWDAWVSVNGGSTWYQLNAAPLLNMTLTSLAFDNSGYLWLVGGQIASLDGSNNYGWTSIVQKSSLSFSTSSIVSWSQTYTGTKFQVTAASLAALSGGRPSWGGNTTALNSSIASVSAFSCAGTTLTNPGSAFNMTFFSNGNGWGSVDIAMQPTPSAIVYGVPWSGTNATYDTYSGYWAGTGWAVAPAGSFVMWGTQEDVAISTNSGGTWTWIAGGGGTGLGWAQNDYDNGFPSTQLLSAGNAECSHRSTFSRFYVIGNNGANNSAIPFEVWASDDAQIWTQVADTATQTALAATPNTQYVGCVVGANDVIYYLGGNQAWQSPSLGRSFSPMTPTSGSYFGPRQYFASAIYSPTASPFTESIVVLGGQIPVTNVALNDVWVSTNYAQTWTQVSANPGFVARLGASLAVSASGVIVMHGGSTGGGTWYSDVWVSITGGSSWFQLAASTGVARSYSGCAFDSNGYFYINSGQGPNWSWNPDVWRSTHSFNNIGVWAPALLPSLTVPSSLQCSQGTAPTTFDMATARGSAPWGVIGSFIRNTQVPIIYDSGYGSDLANQWAVAPAGSWLMYGTQPDVSISTNNGVTWTITSGTNSGNPNLDGRNLAVYPTGTGNTACSHRTSFNRFYLMGRCASYNCSGPWFNWATEDGGIWYEVMDLSSAQSMQARSSTTGALCVVDQSERVYSIGGTDTWASTNLGVSFTKVTPTAYFTTRTNFAGGVYSPTPSTDTFVVVGGNAAQDVWQSVNYGQSWTQVTTSLPWSARTNVNFAINSNGVFVMEGGDLNGGSAEYKDVWMSLTFGASWILLSTGGNAASALSYAAVAFDQQGYFYLVGGQSLGYGWNGAQYRSTLSFNNVTDWASKLSGNGAQPFTPTLPSSPTGSPSLGGLRSGVSTTSPTVPTGSYPCGGVASLPSWSPSRPFDFVVNNTGIGWGNVGNSMGSNVQPLVYEVPWTNSSYYNGYTGNAWAVAPVGSLLVWGGNSDVAISTNGGVSWTAIAGIGGNPGLPQTSQIDYTAGSQGLGAWNTQCQHRNTFNRFYVIGNNQLSTSTTAVLFDGWASDDGLTWYQVMDNATRSAMANDQTSNGLYISDGVCLVGINDIVYYVSGNRTWSDRGTFGVTFTGVTVTSGGYMNQATAGTRFNHAAVIYTTAANTDRIVVLGGQTTYQYWVNDVWASTNYGASWQQVTAAAPWSQRQDAMVAVSQSGAMVLLGGMEYVGGTNGSWVWNSDAWASMDGGATWLLLNARVSAGSLAYGAISVDANGYVVTSGGMVPGWSWSNPNVSRSTYSLNNIQQWYTGVGSSYCSVAVGQGLCPVTAYNNPTACTATPVSNGGGSSSSSLSGGAIAGIVIGSVVGAAVLVLLVLFFCCGASGKLASKSTKYNEQANEHSVRHGEESHNNATNVEMETS